MRDAHVIEERDGGVGPQRAHTESEHHQTMVMLLREAIQDDPKHGFPKERQHTHCYYNVYFKGQKRAQWWR